MCGVFKVLLSFEVVTKISLEMELLKLFLKQFSCIYYNTPVQYIYGSKFCDYLHEQFGHLCALHNPTLHHFTAKTTSVIKL